MNDILSMINTRLSGDPLSTISRQIGADESTTRGAIGAIVPLIVSGLAKNASQPATEQQPWTLTALTIVPDGLGPLDRAAVSSSCATIGEADEENGERAVCDQELG
jgi:hypothetical protein